MDINWTSIIASSISSVINGVAVFLAVRYTTKVVDRVEKVRQKDCKKEEKK